MGSGVAFQADAAPRAPGSVSPDADPASFVTKRLGRVDFRATLEAMQRFTATRTSETPDELWVLEHPPVYTVGLAARAEHFPRRNDIPLERIDRGGQITY